VVDEKAPFTIPISITELIHTLIQEERARGYFIMDSLTIAPFTQVTYTIPVSNGYKAAPIELLALPDPDHTLTMYTKIDGGTFAFDTDMVAALYTQPIKFFKDFYVLKWAEREITVTFYNKSPTQTANINFRFAWAELRVDDIKKINSVYYEVVRKWLLKEGVQSAELL